MKLVFELVTSKVHYEDQILQPGTLLCEKLCWFVEVCYWHSWDSVLSRVCVAVKRPSVSPPVCPSVCPIRPPNTAAAGLLLGAQRPGDSNLLLHSRRSAAAVLQQAHSNICGQCHVVSWRRKLNSDLLFYCRYSVNGTCSTGVRGPHAVRSVMIGGCERELLCLHLYFIATLTYKVVALNQLPYLTPLLTPVLMLRVAVSSLRMNTCS